MLQKEKILKKHNNKIWKGEKNGRYYTYIYENGKRKLLSKKSLEELQNAIIEHLSGKGKEKTVKKNIFRNLCIEWLEQKLEFKEIKKGSYDRYINDYHKYIEKDIIFKKSITEITEYELEIWCKSTIKNHSLTAKAWGNVRVLILGTFKFAKRKGLKIFSITDFFQNLALSKNLFKHSNKKQAEYQVFTDEEVEMIIEYVKNNHNSILNCGVLLAFYTGMRSGELSALKKCDIKDNVISIRRTEQRQKDTNNHYCYTVSEGGKTDASIRDIVITQDCVKLIEHIKRLNPKGEYLLMENDVRYIGKKYTVRLYQICEKLNIQKRSLHKARKTYCTKLINGGVDKSVILAQVGHTDIKTTELYYLYNNKNKKQILKQVENAVSY